MTNWLTKPTSVGNSNAADAGLGAAVGWAVEGADGRADAVGKRLGAAVETTLGAGAAVAVGVGESAGPLHAPTRSASAIARCGVAGLRITILPPSRARTPSPAATRMAPRSLRAA